MQPTLREQAHAELDKLTDEQIITVLAFIESVMPAVEDDPFLNGELVFSGSPDLGEEAENILGQELGRSSS